MAAAFWLIFAVALALNIFVFLCIHPIMSFLQVPEEIYDMMQEYLWIVFWGIFASFYIIILHLCFVQWEIQSYRWYFWQ